MPAPSSSDLRAAVDAGVIDAVTGDRLAAFFAERRTAAAEAPRFDLVHALWYLGALIVLGAMGLFSTTAFGRWGATALLVTSVVYAAVFVAAGDHLWRGRGLRTPGGLLMTCAVGMAPLFVFAVQTLTGNDPTGQTTNYHDFYVWIRSGWLPMELGTIAAALLALVFYPFPFLVMTIAFSLWFLSMDLAPWLLGVDHLTSDQRANVSMAVGLVMLGVAWHIDLRRRKNGDFAFWLHLFGLMAFWGGLTAQHSGDEFGKAAYCFVNLALIFLGVFLARRAYAVFGGFGVALYLGHLAYEVFKDSILFPFALSGVGLLVIGAGLLFHRFGPRLSQAVAAHLPDDVQRLRPAHAREIAPEIAQR